MTFKINNLPFYWRLSENGLNNVIVSNLDFTFAWDEKFSLVTQKRAPFLLDSLKCVYQQDQNIGLLQEDNTIAIPYGKDFLTFLYKVLHENNITKANILELGCGGCILLDELKKPYVITARAKGLPEWRVIMTYPVRVALNPFISTVGWVLPGLVSGTVIVAIVLNLPTTGPMLLNALQSQDMYLAATFVLMLSLLTVVGTLVSDILLAWLDPRIRYR